MRRRVPFAAIAAAGAILFVAASNGCGSGSDRTFDDGQKPAAGDTPPLAPPTAGLGDPAKPKDDGECTKAAAAKGYVGCDFRVLVPFSGGANAAPCFAVFLANASTTPPPELKISLSSGPC